MWKESGSLISVNKSYEQMMQAGSNSSCGIAIYLLYYMPFNQGQESASAFPNQTPACRERNKMKILEYLFLKRTAKDTKS